MLKQSKKDVLYMDNTEKHSTLTDIPNKSICNKFSQMSINDRVLQQNQIDIWQFPLNNLWNDAHAILNLAEQKRAARFHFDIHRNRFIAAHAYLRLILSRYLENKNPNSLEFNENKYGKPMLAINPQKLEFNLSHSDNIGLLAIGQNYPLGVDIECFSTREYLGLANYMFSESECKAIHNITKYLQPQMFFNIWAQKEAFIKACGMGLSYPTQEFDVSPFSATFDKIIDKKNDKLWSISSFKPTITSCGAICHSPNIKNIRYIILENHNDLIR